MRVKGGKSDRVMISRITGTLTDVEEDAVTLAVGPVAIEVLVPARLARELALHPPEGELTLYTLLMVEGGVGAGHLFPRLVGFTDAREREFYVLFTRVKGIGVRKALKALVLPIDQIAQAIEARDVASLKALPEIGPRTADSIVAELQGKAGKFAVPMGVSTGKAREHPESGLIREAVLLLRGLQYSAAEAQTMVEDALRRFPDTTSLDELVRRIFQTSGRPS